jgi:hypothetical protein
VGRSGISEYAARHPPHTTARGPGPRRPGRRPSPCWPGCPHTPARRRPSRQRARHADQATLIEWGSSRIGPAALDLANLVTADSADVARYTRTWQQLTGQPLSGGAIELGYRWAALQIPVQYLPWTIWHQPTRDVEAVLDQIEQALGRL